MSGVTGREMKAVAFAKCGTNSWNVAASVTKGARFASDGGMKYTPTFVEDRSFGETFLGPAEYGDTAPPDVTFEGQARYDDYNYILEACAMGSPATVAIATSASGQTTSWRHVIDLAPSIDGLCVTVAVDRKLYVEEMTSAKVYGFSETYGDAGIVNQSFKLLGSTVTDISSININSTVYGASYPSLLGKMFRSQGVFRINAQSGGSLSGSDAIVAEGFEFTFTRPQDQSFGTSSGYIVEPADNEFPEVTATVTFPRMNTITANSFRTALRAGTAYKLDVTYTGLTYINSTDRYSKLIQAPYAELQDFETATAGAAQVKPKATFKLKKPSAAPTGMTGVTTPFRITRVMQNSVNAFA
jgi:hypothetical protein